MPLREIEACQAGLDGGWSWMAVRDQPRHTPRRGLPGAPDRRTLPGMAFIWISLLVIFAVVIAVTLLVGRHPARRRDMPQRGTGRPDQSPDVH
ncbi:hypothetical protein GCM10012284_63450 [Mangrovihabitans endophyticus]|uniref:Uncharacterized protein n=1 Tax=Mangrovihabitans endophyticus TaxID=1751298 RepID=A0A8J3C8X3_9ACTN|nr:hypothetical protein GCM10012284_63450 [Mangrovihabitans endophyticus]